MNLCRNTFHKYISVMAKQLAFFRVSTAQPCASHSATYSDDVRFINYTIILTIIITQMRMTYRNSMTQTNSLRPLMSKHGISSFSMDYLVYVMTPCRQRNALVEMIWLAWFNYSSRMEPSNPLETDSHGATLSHWECESGKLDVVKCLVQYKTIDCNSGFWLCID